MKRTILILVGGLTLAAAAYGTLFMARTAQRETDSPQELLWLRQEFSLSEQEFARIRELHEGYLPDCAKMCAQIAAANRDLEGLILSTNAVTPQIREKLSEISRIRQECQTRMLQHFYAVSQAMPAEQGRRYLVEMQKLTSLSTMRDHSTSEPAQSEHGHRM